MIASLAWMWVGTTRSRMAGVFGVPACPAPTPSTIQKVPRNTARRKTARKDLLAPTGPLPCSQVTAYLFRRITSPTSTARRPPHPSRGWVPGERHMPSPV